MIFCSREKLTQEAKVSNLKKKNFKYQTWSTHWELTSKANYFNLKIKQIVYLSFFFFLAKIKHNNIKYLVAERSEKNNTPPKHLTLKSLFYRVKKYIFHQNFG